MYNAYRVNVAEFRFSAWCKGKRIDKGREEIAASGSGKFVASE